MGTNFLPLMVQTLILMTARGVAKAIPDTCGVGATTTIGAAIDAVTISRIRALGGAGALVIPTSIVPATRPLAPTTTRQVLSARPISRSGLGGA